MGKRKLAKYNKKKSSVSKFLREVFLSPIGNCHPFKIKLVAISDFSLVEKFSRDLVGQPIFVYRQGSQGEIKQVICLADNEDKTHIFLEQMKDFEEQLKSSGLSQKLPKKNLEIMKALNFLLEGCLNTEVLHVVFSEQDAEELAHEAQQITEHWHSVYGSVKGISIDICEELAASSKNKGPTFH